MIGFCFGFVLERAGFGNARNLVGPVLPARHARAESHVHGDRHGDAAAFSLPRRLGCWTFNPCSCRRRYFWSGVAGGLVLGVGFIIGGYCPGTSLVVAVHVQTRRRHVCRGRAVWIARLRLDSAGLGNSGIQGIFERLTLPDLAGMDAGLVVVAVVLMAVGAFWFAEWVVRRFSPTEAGRRPGRLERRWRRLAMAVALAIALFRLSFVSPHGSPGSPEKGRDPELLASRPGTSIPRNCSG